MVGEMSDRGDCKLGNFSVTEMSDRGTVWLRKCPVRELYSRGNIHWRTVRPRWSVRLLSRGTVCQGIAQESGKKFHITKISLGEVSTVTLHHT